MLWWTSSATNIGVLLQHLLLNSLASVCRLLLSQRKFQNLFLTMTLEHSFTLIRGRYFKWWFRNLDFEMWTVCFCVCMCVWMCWQTWELRVNFIMKTKHHTYKHPKTAFVCVCVCVCVCVRLRAFLRARVYMRVRACVLARLCVCVRAREREEGLADQVR